MKNSRRRGVIKALSSEEDMLGSLVGLFLDRDDFRSESKFDIVEQVASWETGFDVGEVPERKLDSVECTLHQDHLPLLDDRDIINYSEADRVLEAVPETDEYAELVEDRPGKGTAFPGVDSSGVPSLTVDLGYQILSNDRRRHVLDYVDGSGEPVDISSVSEYIARMESDSPGALSSGERKNVYVGLHQCHLPRMDEAEVIDYDGDRKTIEKGENFENLVNYLPDELESI